MSELPERPDNTSAPPTGQQPSSEGQKNVPEPHKTKVDSRHKATQFDGNGNPQAAENAPSTLSPRDDTPTFLEEKSPKK